MSTYVGLAIDHPDAAAAAIREGRVVAAVEEERFRRVKHWSGFPEESLRFCVRELGVDPLAIDGFAIARAPRAQLGRKLAYTLTHPASLSLALDRAGAAAHVSRTPERLRACLGLARAPRVVHVEHHRAHVASAFYPSPFETAACVSIDGFGDFVSTMIARGRGARTEVLERVCFPHSLGVFYTAITQWLGFPGFGDEYKVMGLAAYGEPRLTRVLEGVCPGDPDGSFRLELACFRHARGGLALRADASGAPLPARVFTAELEARLGPARRPDEELTDRHRDVAASLQHVFEARYLALVRRAIRLTGERDVTLAGGCALSSAANGKVLAETDARALFVQPAAGDAGTALGAALFAHHEVDGRPRVIAPMEHAALGPRHDETAIRASISRAWPSGGGEDVSITDALDEVTLLRETAEALARGEVVGWYTGRAEWGPRALGQRSILADPRRADMRELLNVKIKRREPFRPFAPSILEERIAEWIEGPPPDPFMLRVVSVRPEQRARIPAVVHVDGTARAQSVSDRSSPRLAALLRAFDALTGVPMLLDTSFNESEPIVDTPDQAIDCFRRTKMDRLVLERTVVARR